MKNKLISERMLYTGALLLSIMPLTLAQKNISAKEHTNIVLFVADDLGAADIEPYGNQIVNTPNLESLAKESLLFSQAFASSPTCSPSRASIHTGIYPFRNGAHANHSGIKEDVKTLPSYLKPLGYRVAIAGKFHVGPIDQYPFEFIHNTNVPEPGHEGQGVLWTDLNMAPVDEWLAKISKSKEPFMLVVNDHSPHVFWPEKAEYEASEIDIPGFHIDTKETRKSRARYYTDITKMDGNVGKLLSSLEKYKMSENTIVIFTADQGPQWAFGKWNLYDYGIRVPLLIKWPGKIKGGSETDAIVSLIDLLPTAVEIAGGTPPASPEVIDGMSIIPLLLGQKCDHRQRVYASHSGDGVMNQSPLRMIRTSRYKYILNLAPEIKYTTHIDKSKGGHDEGQEYWFSWETRSHENDHAAAVLWRYHNRPKEELYDVTKDPYELVNLAGNPYYKDIVEDFRADMAEWREQQGDKESGPFVAPPRDNKPPVAPYIFK